MPFSILKYIRLVAESVTVKVFGNLDRVQNKLTWVSQKKKKKQTVLALV